jgi:ParB family chromosome partitioning protein
MEINSITVKQGRRAIDSAKVRELANSMSEIGLINPITVTQDRVLITGAHRLEAAKLLGWTDIQATEVELDELLEGLHEIDENLIRNEMGFIDRGNAYKRRNDLLTTYGMKREVGRYSNSPDYGQLKTTQEIAKEMGVSKSKMLEEIQIATNILPEVQDAIKAADLPKTDALKIARLEPHEQIKIANQITNGAKTYKEARVQERKDANRDMSASSMGKELPSNITLYEGDVFEQIGNIKDSSVDLLNTDPPYMVLDHDWDTFKSLDDFMSFTERWLLAVMPKIKSTGRAYISFSGLYQYEFYDVLRHNNFFGMNYGQTIIWHAKNNNKPFNRHIYRSAYDPIFYLYGKDAPDLNFTADTFGEMQNNVWTIALPQSNFNEGKLHPTQKPLELYRNIVMTGSKEGDTVLDCFAGSGTTGVICNELKRDCILIERNPEYIGFIKGRVNE